MSLFFPQLLAFGHSFAQPKYLCQVVASETKKGVEELIMQGFRGMARKTGRICLAGFVYIAFVDEFLLIIKERTNE